MKLYRFSPIKTKTKLKEAIQYVVEQTTKLGQISIGQKLPISSVTIFSHYQKEFEFLEKLILQIGKPYNENNGPRVCLNEPINIGNNLVKQLRIRKPDPYRMQVGCNDFDVIDYVDFKNKYLRTYPDKLRLITRDEYEMIEFYDPDFDVFAYVVSIPV